MVFCSKGRSDNPCVIFELRNKYGDIDVYFIPEFVKFFACAPTEDQEVRRKYPDNMLQEFVESFPPLLKAKLFPFSGGVGGKIFDKLTVFVVNPSQFEIRNKLFVIEHPRSQTRANSDNHYQAFFSFACPESHFC